MVRTLFLFLLSNFLIADLLPFHIKYHVQKTGGFSFKGEAISDLSYQNKNNRWLFDFQANAKLGSLQYKSLFEYKNNSILSKEYSFNKNILFKNQNFKIIFNKEEALIDNNKFQVPLNVLDPINYELALEIALSEGKTFIEYDVLHEKGLSREIFQVIGKEKLKTAVGLLNTIKVQKITSNKERKTFIWFSEDYNYLLIFLKQIEPNGDTYQIFLKEGSINNEQIQGVK